MAAGLLEFITIGSIEPLVLLADGIAIWILINLAMDWHARIANKKGKLISALKQPLSYYGMLLGHLGIAISIVGVGITVYFSEEKDVRMEPGSVVTMSGYEFQLNKMTKVEGPNYLADQADLTVTRDGQAVVSLYPQKRFYRTTGKVMTEADMNPRLFRDLYVALGDRIEGDAWAVRIHYKPFVRWIWFGGVLVAAGGLMAVADRRYRLRQRKPKVSKVIGVSA
jgi:cytochrome c-type biogenesis protein CcmF